MTPAVLLDELKKFIEEATKDMLLPVNVKSGSGKPKERPPEIYLMRLPSKDAELQQIPYVLLQFLKNTDSQQAGEHPESVSMVRIVAATYGKDHSEGALCVLNVLTRIRVALLRSGMIGGQFILKPPVEMIVYPESSPPYFLGEMVTNWATPTIESEASILWQQ